MPATSKTLSPAELAKLEHAFATDPASEAYKPLAEAYLGMGRFMEAMVVCKKGVKAHPNDAHPRVLLARVYAAQSKDKKALEELQGALQVAPNDVSALRMTGALQLKGGEAAPGRDNLLKAHAAAPTDEETLAAMAQFGVEAPKQAPAPAAPAPPVLLPTPAVAPAAAAGAPAAPAPAANGVSSAPAPSTPMRRPSSPAVPRATGGRQPPRRLTGEYEESISGLSEVSLSEASRSSTRTSSKKGSSKSRFGMMTFVLLILSVPIAAGAYYGIGQYRGKIKREVKKQVQAAQDFIKGDSFDSYKKACEAGEKALDLDPGSLLAHRYLAYAYTVRWCEHERDDEMRKRATEHLTEGRGTADVEEGRSYLFASEALFKFCSGQGAEGLKELEDRVKSAEAENKRSSMLYLTVGILQMTQGDLERAKESLEKAQTASPDDPRIFVALGTLARRRGNDAQALTHFNSALRYTRNSHPEALLGTALLILDQENPGNGYITAAKYLKTLLEADPPPSPRQLAQAHMVKALLVSRVAHDIPLFTNKDFQRELENGTGVSPDATKAKAEITSNENDAFSKDRSNPELSIIKAKRLFYEERYDDAAAEVRKAIEQNNTQAHFHVELARVLMKKEGGEVQAEEALKKALSLVPGSPKLLAMLGQAQYRGKKVDEARATLEKAAADSKTRNPEARFLLGRILRDDKKEYEKAAVMLDQAAKEYFSDPTMAATALDESAQAWEIKGEKDKARTAFEKALNSDKDYAGAYCHYAKFLAKNAADAKDKEKMKALAAEGLKLDPQGACAAELKPLAGG